MKTRNEHGLFHRLAAELFGTFWLAPLLGGLLGGLVHRLWEGEAQIAEAGETPAAAAPRPV